MNQEEIKHLAEKFLNGTATPEEKEVLHSWYVPHPEGAEELVFTSKPEDADVIKSRLYTQIQGRLSTTTKVAVARKVKLWKRLATVAAVFLVAGIAIQFYMNYANFRTERRIADTKLLLAGTNRATLTLANGKTINLNDAKTGVVIDANSLKYNDGTVIPEVDPSGQYGERFRNDIKVSTPKGGQYQVILPDGTRAWLNAASSLKFPSSFAKLDLRKVELIGEAYFEVAKDGAHPFIVATDKQQVEVLGTHFNINSYADEPGTRTTLLEGAVRVSTAQTNSPVNRKSDIANLLPGQQSVVTGSVVKIIPADTEEAIAWKNGYFKFNSEPISSIMRKLSRWYDVEVVYEGEVSKDKFGGTISRYKNVGEVLDMLESTKLVKFKVEGRKIIVR
jgi:transmembrane sensor